MKITGKINFGLKTFKVARNMPHIISFHVINIVWGDFFKIFSLHGGTLVAKKN